MDQKQRNRCEEACLLLETAIEALDECGHQDAATHAHHCLELIRATLAEDALDD